MPSEKARSLDHFYELLATGQHPKIELDFDVAADDFFKIAHRVWRYWREDHPG